MDDTTGPMTQLPSDDGDQAHGGRRDGRRDFFGRDDLVARVQAENRQLHEELTAVRQQVSNLQQALSSNRRIGMAIGILMFKHKITEDQAFQLLRLTSQHTHRKLAELANDVLDTGQLDLPHGLLVAEAGRPSD